MAVRFRLPSDSLLTDNGKVLAGGTIAFYASGSSTPQAVYSDDGLSTAADNPYDLDAAGRHGDIFLQGKDYKVVLKDAAGVTIKTIDPVHGASNSDFVGSYAALRTHSGAADALSGVLVFTIGSGSGLLTGAEGYWRYDPDDTTTPDDACTVLVSNKGGRWKRVIDGPYRIEWSENYSGADGVTSCAQAFEDVINAADGQEVRLRYAPSGYLIDRALVLTTDSFRLTSDTSNRGYQDGRSAQKKTKVIFKPAATGTSMIRRYDITSTTEAIGPFESTGIGYYAQGDYLAGSCFFELGVADVDGDGTNDVVSDTGDVAQRYIMPITLIENGFFGPAMTGNTDDATVDTTGFASVKLTKCFEAVVRGNTFQGGYIQLWTWGCDHPLIHDNRFNEGAIPIWLNGSGSFVVQHLALDNQIEGWIHAAVVWDGVGGRLTGRFEQNTTATYDNHPVDMTDEWAITADVTAGSKTVTFSEAMDDFVIPGLTVIEFSNGWEADALVITAGGASHAVGDVITFTKGVKIKVTSVSTGAVVTAYMTERGASDSDDVVPTGALTQSGTTGSGTSATITPTWRKKDVVSAKVVSVSGADVVFHASDSTDTIPYGDTLVIFPWTNAAARAVRIHGACLVVSGSCDMVFSPEGTPRDALTPLLIWQPERGSVRVINATLNGQPHTNSYQSLILANQGPPSAFYQQTEITFMGCAANVVADPQHPLARVDFIGSGCASQTSSTRLDLQARGASPTGERRRWLLTPESGADVVNFGNRVLRKKCDGYLGSPATLHAWAIDASGDIITGVALADFFHILRDDLPTNGYVRIRTLVRPLALGGTPNVRLAFYDGVNADYTAIPTTALASNEWTMLENVTPVSSSWHGPGCGFLFDQSSYLCALIEVEEIFAHELATLPRRRVVGTSWAPGAIANGAQVSTTVTVTGATVGCRAEASFGVALAGLAGRAEITAADTVTVYLSNASGGSLTPTVVPTVTAFWG